MSYICFKCRTEVALLAGNKVGRRDSCPKCGSDLHACLNCEHYDEKAYNQCREPQADRVLDKDRSNFCDYFSFRSGSGGAKVSDPKEKAMKDLDSLFKK